MSHYFRRSTADEWHGPVAGKREVLTEGGKYGRIIVLFSFPPSSLTTIPSAIEVLRSMILTMGTARCQGPQGWCPWWPCCDPNLVRNRSRATNWRATHLSVTVSDIVHLKIRVLTVAKSTSYSPSGHFICRVGGLERHEKWRPCRVCVIVYVCLVESISTFLITHFPLPQLYRDTYKRASR